MGRGYPGSGRAWTRRRSSSGGPPAGGRRGDPRCGRWNPGRYAEGRVRARDERRPGARDRRRRRLLAARRPQAARACAAAGGPWRVGGFVDDAERARRDATIDGLPGRRPDRRRPGPRRRSRHRDRPARRLHHPAAHRRAPGARRPTRYATIVHPSGSFGETTVVGPGTVVLANVVATTHGSRSARHVALMPGIVLTHDDVIGDYATLAAGRPASAAGCTSVPAHTSAPVSRPRGRDDRCVGHGGHGLGGHARRPGRASSGSEARPTSTGPLRSPLMYSKGCRESDLSAVRRPRRAERRNRRRGRRRVSTR